jgi:hypothetical protein|tara:strand:+ start:630 stop:776 length:147 start_codon:yes stop_codon:yes gene_type:complete
MMLSTVSLLSRPVILRVVSMKSQYGFSALWTRGMKLWGMPRVAGGVEL